MWFAILGALSVRADQATVAVTAARERIILATLLLHPNNVVPVSELVDAVWAERPPRTARAQVHGIVCRLRHSLGAGGGTPTDPIGTDPVGYRIRVSGDQLDTLVLDRLLSLARTATAERRLPDARQSVRAALRLFRGPPLAGVPSRTVQAAAAALEEQRSSAAELCFDVELRLGLTRELISELTLLVDRYPLRERLQGQLALALYRSGRAADALAVCRRARQAFVGELGVEPGPHLTGLQHRMLVGDATLLAPAAVAAAEHPVEVGMARENAALRMENRRLQAALARARRAPPRAAVAVSGLSVLRVD